MATQQGSLALLDDPVAQKLLQSTLPARLAYNWSDGTPRVVPIWFHWNGKEIVLGTFPAAPKMKVLKDGTKVAVTIDSDSMPYKVLMIRGSVHIDTVEGISPEYRASAQRVLGEEQGQAFTNQVQPIMTRTSRIFIRPEWVAIQDFETRFPNAMERAMERAAGAGA
jgi:Pyridoxamine 5'-phosphate oxidase